MRRRAIVLSLVLTLAPAAGDAAALRRAAPAASRSRPSRAPARARPPTLAEAKAAMSALMRDRARRRFHHQWERAIQNLLRAARGKDAGPAQLEAARARYALYRWSANEADREAALSLARKAERLGSKEAPAFAKAIRREAGDGSEERRAPAQRRRPAPAATASARV
jgi:N-acetylmuramoyl-L-alanine amidase